MTNFDWNPIEIDMIKSNQIHLVWETTCERDCKDAHANALILNRLNNSQILEDKSNFAFLNLSIEFPCLDTFIAGKISEIEVWADRRWRSSNISTPCVGCEGDWWAVKSSRGNGGRDVYVINSSNYCSVLSQIPSVGEFVLQRYVTSPLLWRNKKFHFRCYSLLMSDMSAFLYNHAFILTAGVDYDEDTVVDIRKHVTNLSVNKHIPGHPGQVPCSLHEEYPYIFEQMKTMWARIAFAASPFMQEQQSGRFEMFGLDVIADSTGGCWLIELNRNPGLESSALNTSAEDQLYNDMISELLSIVVPPILHSGVNTSLSNFSGTNWTKVWGGCLGVSDSRSSIGAESSSIDTGSNPCHWKNLMNWRAYIRKNRDKVVLSRMLV